MKEESMSMSTHVIGFRPADEEWQKMRAAWEACKSAGVEPPREVDRFFNGEPPDPAGVEVPLGDAVTAYRADMQEGFEVHLDKLPPGLKVIRFYNSW